MPIRLDGESISFLVTISEDVGFPYPVINLYLRDCAGSHRITSQAQPELEVAAKV